MFAQVKDFFVNRRERKIARALRIVKNSKAIKEDRVMAIEFFYDFEDSEIAVPALLERFEFSLEHGINDTREKERAMAGILKHGAKALPLVREHLKKTLRIAWPIKILQKIGNETEIVESLLGALNYGDVSFDQAIVDKNYDILCYLADYKVPGMYTKISHFLTDPDERVRFACVECLVTQDDDAGIKPLLEPFLVDDTSENRRLRMAVINLFVKKDWRIDGLEQLEPGLLVEGVFVTKKRKLEKR